MEVFSMAATPVIKFVTRTDPANPGANKKYTDIGNSEVNIVTPLNFGSLNIDADTWSAVKVVWGQLTDLSGNARVNAMKFYVDGSFNNQTGIQHYDKITKDWEAPGSAGTRQTGNASSGKTYTDAKALLKDDGIASELTAIDQFTQFIFCQLFVQAGTPVGAHVTGEGKGRAKMAFNYS
ncbi:MAG: hypothetical protein WCE94_02845 [Candidatus Methanoperedens sp.]